MANTLMALNPVNGLAALQSKFAISMVGGELRIIDLDALNAIRQGHSCEELHFFKKDAFINVMKRHLEALQVRTKPKDDIDNFLVDPRTQVFTTTAFSPVSTAPDVLNLWSDPPIEPVRGNWDIINDHLFRVICNSCPVKYDYLKRFLAHMLQKPEEKPGVMIVLKGGQGSGKGALLQVIQRIWQNASLFTADINHVVGTFTGALERSYAVLLDEALFWGDKKSQDRMKSLISEPRCQIEVKYQPSRSISSVHRFFATTNHIQFGKTEVDDRRHAFFEVSNSKQNDHHYFKSLFTAIDDDQVIAALIYDLMNMDLVGFNVRVRPRNSDHGAQVLKSLEGFERYWHHLLCSGDLPGVAGYMLEWGSEGEFVSTQSLWEGFGLWERNRSKHDRPTYADISDLIKRLCPSAVHGRHKVNNRQQRGYNLPSLQEARKEFQGALGVAVDWIDS